MRSAGFTLLEISLVIAIIGLLTGAVVLSLRVGIPSTHQSASRLTSHLEEVSDLAVLQHKTVGLFFTSQRLTSRTFDGENWQPSPLPDIVLPPHHRWQLKIAGNAIHPSLEAPRSPHLVVYPGGETVAATVQIDNEEGDAIKIRLDALGRTQLIKGANG